MKALRLNAWKNSSVLEDVPTYARLAPGTIEGRAVTVSNEASAP